MGAVQPHRVVIVGSGFGGLFAARALRRAPVEVTLVAMTAHHLFQPLLYQVATGILSEGEIAPSTREILRRQRNAHVVQGLVEQIDLRARTVTSRFHDHVTVTGYDSLIVAAGAGQSYFGNERFAVFAPGMKTIDDALELRSRIFGAFERAEIEHDPANRARLLTFVVVGAGPTGVEMAGQIRELSSTTLARDFRRFDPRSARVVLIDAASQVLPTFGSHLGRITHRSLDRLGIDVILDAMVVDVDDVSVTVRHGDGRIERIESVCKVWAAGVEASPLGRTLAHQSGAELDRAGRVRVGADLTLPGHPEVFVVGDMMAVEGVPGVAQAAIQAGRFAARRIIDRVGRRAVDEPFRYRDKGSMATIARFRAVVSIGRIRVSGFAAWLMWLLLHLVYITGFKQRVGTLLRWLITFVSNGRSERVTTNQQLVGRLALRRLGTWVSGALLRDERPADGPVGDGGERS